MSKSSRHRVGEVIAERVKPSDVGGERDDDREGAAEPFEVIAQGDHVFLTGQSNHESVEDGKEGVAAVVAESPAQPWGFLVRVRSRSASSMPL